jgi:hypothetical protein
VVPVGRDLSVAIPVLRTGMNVISCDFIQRIGTTDPNILFFANGQPGSPGYYGKGGRSKQRSVPVLSRN